MPANAATPDPARPAPGARASRARVVIVGAGPAGSVSALLLARQGVAVDLIDRETFPRPKPCGDCLSAAATGLLERLGVLDAVMAGPHARLRGWDVVAPGGCVTPGRFGRTPALAIERAVFDALLVDAARDAGARLRHLRVHDLSRDPDGRVTGVVGREAGGDTVAIRADLVVGADGLRSIVARRLGAVHRLPRLKKLSLTTHVQLDGLDLARGEMHLLDGACVGLAPVGRGRYNLTLVVDGSHSDALRDLGAESFLHRWVDRAPAVRARVGEARFEDLLASGPFDWPVRSATVAGAALVGDAAGYYDPFTGQGVYHGMRASEILAALVGPALAVGDAGPALHAYARAHRRMTRPARRLQRLIEGVLARPILADLALRRLARAPSVMDRLVAVTGDLVPPRSLISPALLSTFLFPSRTENP